MNSEGPSRPAAAADASMTRWQSNATTTAGVWPRQLELTGDRFAGIASMADVTDAVLAFSPSTVMGHWQANG